MKKNLCTLPLLSLFPPPGPKIKIKIEIHDTLEPVPYIEKTGVKVKKKFILTIINYFTILYPNSFLVYFMCTLIKLFLHSRNV